MNTHKGEKMGSERVDVDICGMIYKTKNYDLFRYYDGNRIVTEARINAIMDSLKEGEVLNPIVVTEDMRIIDGQGRYEALKRLGRPIRYIIDFEADEKSCMCINQYASTWKPEDFARLFSRGGENAESYERYLNLCSIGISSSTLRVLTGDSNDKAKRFKKGDYSLSEEQARYVLEVCRAAKELYELFPARTSGRNPSDRFVRAFYLCYMQAEYDHETMMRRARACQSTLILCGTITEQVKEFSRVYNYKARKDELVHFEDVCGRQGYNVRRYDTVPKKAQNAQTLKGAKGGNKK